MRPADEPVQSASPRDQLVARPQIEVIGIGEYECSAQFFDLCGREGLDGRLCANRCEDGRDEVAVRCVEDARAGAVVARGNVELEH